GGLSLHRFLPIHPSVTTPTTNQNTYVKYNNLPEVQWHADIDYVDAAGNVKTAYASWRGGDAFKDADFLAADPANRKSIKAVKYTQLGSAAGARDGVLSQINQLTYCSDLTQEGSQCSTSYLN